MNKVKISCSIVIYNENINVLNKTIQSFLSLPYSYKLYIIDNSDLKEYKPSFNSIEYIKNKTNIGFGSAHNLVLNKIKNKSEYHLVLNPDVEFDAGIFKELFYELEKDIDLMMISPKVLYPDGRIQYTCRKHPTIKELISRRLGIYKDYTLAREYRDKDLAQAFYPDFIHGCFMLFKTSDFIKLKGFDERYFLYLEDADICREIKQEGKKIMYYPNVYIKHAHRKGSAKKIKLLLYHISSAFKYFNKWGIN
ncbi:Glyco_trans_2-like domain-containing protein [Tenacibaculum sp. 190524A02b]|uniref:Glyco_trans_2-like domain-containing protein n=1 Tax=Tenacibaculum vairaonense TaxID=3137860 RepID=A0ABM9PJC8_9FLAO